MNKAVQKLAKAVAQKINVISTKISALQEINKGILNSIKIQQLFAILKITEL